MVVLDTEADNTWSQYAEKKSTLQLGMCKPS